MHDEPGEQVTDPSLGAEQARVGQVLDLTHRALTSAHLVAMDRRHDIEIPLRPGDRLVGRTHHVHGMATLGLADHLDLDPTRMRSLEGADAALECTERDVLRRDSGLGEDSSAARNCGTGVARGRGPWRDGCRSDADPRNRDGCEPNEEGPTNGHAAHQRNAGPTQRGNGWSLGGARLGVVADHPVGQEEVGSGRLPGGAAVVGQERRVLLPHEVTGPALGDGERLGGAQARRCRTW